MGLANMGRLPSKKCLQQQQVVDWLARARCQTRRPYQARQFHMRIRGSADRVKTPRTTKGMGIQRSQERDVKASEPGAGLPVRFTRCTQHDIARLPPSNIELAQALVLLNSDT